MRKLLVLPAAGLLLALSAAPASADLVCPVITSDAVAANNPKATPLGGSGGYTVAPSGATNLNVPDRATNADGTGSPSGTHSAPGDKDYTAIWNTP